MLGRSSKHAASLMLSLSSRGYSSSGPSAALPVMSVWCVGRNYAEHIKELGNGPADGSLPDFPMIFLKSGSSILPSGQPLCLPRWSSDVHHEVELAVQLGMDLQPVRAAVSLDMTLRDIQAQLKRDRHPWTLAKSFKQSTTLGSWFELPAAGLHGPVDLQDVQLHLTVNGKIRQLGNTSDMLFKIEGLIEYIKDRFPVVPGDIILTGTPHGVSAVRVGDKLVAQVRTYGGQVLSEGAWQAVVEEGP